MKYLKFRRILEIFFIVLLSPILLIVHLVLSILVTMDNKGKIIFRQKRIGRNEKEFDIYKFQSLNNRNGNDGSEDINSHDISNFSKFLRNHKLDEIPQLINLIKGDLYLIGPRPETVKEYNKYSSEIPGYKLRKLIPQGITGWAQVNHPPSETIEGNKIKLEYDLFYINNLSLKLDLKIVLKTIIYVSCGKLNGN